MDDEINPVCPVCLDNYKLPVYTIDICQHKFCQFCIEKYMDSVKPNLLRCPACNVNFCKQNVKVDRQYSDLVQHFAKPRTPGTVECSCKQPATHRCVDCPIALCNACQISHKAVPLTSTHTLQLLADVHEEISEGLATMNVKQKEHVGKVQNIVEKLKECKTNLVQERQKFQRVNDNNKKVTMQAIEKLFDYLQEQTDKHFESVETKLHQEISSQENSLQESKVKCDNLDKRIQEHSDKTHTSIDVDAKELLRNIQQDLQLDEPPLSDTDVNGLTDKFAVKPGDAVEKKVLEQYIEKVLKLTRTSTVQYLDNESSDSQERFSYVDIKKNRVVSGEEALPGSSWEVVSSNALVNPEDNGTSNAIKTTPPPVLKTELAGNDKHVSESSLSDVVDDSACMESDTENDEMSFHDNDVDTLDQPASESVMLDLVRPFGTAQISRVLVIDSEIWVIPCPSKGILYRFNSNGEYQYMLKLKTNIGTVMLEVTGAAKTATDYVVSCLGMHNNISNKYGLIEVDISGRICNLIREEKAVDVCFVKSTVVCLFEEGYIRGYVKNFGKWELTFTNNLHSKEFDRVLARGNHLILSSKYHNHLSKVSFNVTGDSDEDCEEQEIRNISFTHVNTGLLRTCFIDRNQCIMVCDTGNNTLLYVSPTEVFEQFCKLPLHIEDCALENDNLWVIGYPLTGEKNYGLYKLNMMR